MMIIHRSPLPASPFTRTTKFRMRGFTLVEILTALFVMVIGISGTLAIIMRSSQMGTSASDRNNASILLPEAIDEIKRSLIVNSSDGVPDHLGEYMDTVNLTGSGNPFASILFTDPKPVPVTYYRVPFASFKYPKNLTQQDTQGNDLSLVYWPFSRYGSRVMGQRLMTTIDPITTIPTTTGNTGMQGSSGAAYRALFKLEPHPDWVPNPFDRTVNREIPGSAFVGVYVLTITMYRDLNPEVPTDATPSFTPAVQNVKKLQQVSDPVVVFLHDTKARN